MYTVTLLVCCLLALGTPHAAQGADERPPGMRAAEVAARAYVHFGLGSLMETQGFLAESLVQYRRAQSLDPDRCGIATSIGRVLLARGNYDAAVEQADADIARCSDADEAIAVKAEALSERGDAEEAVRVLQEAAARSDASSRILVLLGEQLLSQGRFAEAEGVYRAAASDDSLSADTAYLLSRALMLGGRHEDGLAEARRAVRLDPDNRYMRVTLSRLLLADGKPAEAAKLLRRLVSRSDAGESEYVSLARAYTELGEYAQAKEVLSDALARWGESAPVLETLGATHFREGAMDSAMVVFERVLLLDPDSVLALNFVAYTYADAGENLDTALLYASKAAALDPQNGVVRDTLGWTYYRLGRWEDSRRELEMAVGLGQAEAVILEHLGDVYEALGEEALAHSAWLKALELEPERASTRARLGEAPRRSDRDTTGSTDEERKSAN